MRRVIIAVRDPNPEVSSIQQLSASGIQVIEGVLNGPAVELNEGFFHYIRTGHPFVLLKLAMTLDGKIAAKTGESRWITGEKSRSRVHRLRFEYDAILVGIGTILKDNPSLDVRWREKSAITKVILDRYLRTPSSARIFDSGDRVVIYHSREATDESRAALKGRASLREVGTRGTFLDWSQIIGEMPGLSIASLLIEGGSRVAGSALRAGIVQKVNLFYGPRILGGRDIAGVADMGKVRLDDAVQLENLKIRKLGLDFLVQGDVVKSGRSSLKDGS